MEDGHGVAFDVEFFSKSAAFAAFVIIKADAGEVDDGEGDFSIGPFLEDLMAEDLALEGDGEFGPIRAGEDGEQGRGWNFI